TDHVGGSSFLYVLTVSPHPTKEQLGTMKSTRSLLLIAVFAGLWGVPALGADERPNILLIFTDDHAAHSMSCYGSKINQTPNLDRIAQEGMRFDKCYVTNSLCGPCRAVILTGKYSHLNGFYRNGNRF